MKGRPVKRILPTAIFLVATTAAAQNEAPDVDPSEDDIGLKIGTVEEGDDERKSYRSRRPKVRDGSWLAKDKPLPEVVKVRSRYEAFLEAELRKHYARLAVLDRIMELAEENDDDSLAARTDTVRRKEVQRFRRVMTDFRAQAQARRVAGFDE